MLFSFLLYVFQLFLIFSFCANFFLISFSIVSHLSNITCSSLLHLHICLFPASSFRYFFLICFSSLSQNFLFASSLIPFLFLITSSSLSLFFVITSSSLLHFFLFSSSFLLYLFPLPSPSLSYPFLNTFFPLSLSFSDQIRPICLPDSARFQHEDEFVGMNPFVAGYGATKHQGATSNVLREAQVPIVSRQSCEQSYKSVFQFVQFSNKVRHLCEQ